MWIHIFNWTPPQSWDSGFQGRKVSFCQMVFSFYLSLSHLEAQNKPCRSQHSSHRADIPLLHVLEHCLSTSLFHVEKGPMVTKQEWRALLSSQWHASDRNPDHLVMGCSQHAHPWSHLRLLGKSGSKDQAFLTLPRNTLYLLCTFLSERTEQVWTPSLETLSNDPISWDSPCSFWDAWPTLGPGGIHLLKAYLSAHWKCPTLVSLAAHISPPFPICLGFWI